MLAYDDRLVWPDAPERVAAELPPRTQSPGTGPDAAEGRAAAAAQALHSNWLEELAQTLLEAVLQLLQHVTAALLPAWSMRQRCTALPAG